MSYASTLIADTMAYLARRVLFARYLENSFNALKVMYDAGVPIAMGSDAGNWPLFLTYFHGWSTIMELGFMEQAGMPLDAIIESSTRIPAEMMGLTDRIGTVEVGKYADLIVLDGDPLTDIGAYQALKWTIKNGVCKTPEQWMS